MRAPTLGEFLRELADYSDARDALVRVYEHCAQVDGDSDAVKAVNDAVEHVHSRRRARRIARRKATRGWQQRSPYPCVLPEYLLVRA